MSSFREFLDSDCGQMNPVLKVASHFTQDASFRESLAAGLGMGAAAAAAATVSGSSKSHQNDPYLQDYLERSHQEVAALPPTSFQMDSLIREIQSMESPQMHRPIPGPGIADYARQPDWAAEFMKDEHSLKVTSAAWAGDYFSSELDPVWDASHESYSLPIQHDMPISHPLYARPHHPPTLSSDLTARELLDDSKWADDYIAAPETKTELMTTAGDLLNAVSDPTLKATEFMSFVEKLSTGEVDFDKQEQEKSGGSVSSLQNPEAGANTWTSEYVSQFSGALANPQSWAEEFASQENNFLGPPSGIETEEGKEDFWMKLQDEWDRLAQEESGNHPWLTESANQQQPNQAYTFAEQNPFEQLADPLSEGKKKLLEGDIPSAVLLFESAVQKFPENPECWLLLGTTQAQNEQDPLAITALNKCLTIEPNNLLALMALAASLTNESYHLQAANALKRWLKFNPKYSDIIDDDVRPLHPSTTSILPSEELTRVQRWYMQAARMNPTQGIDPDVQSGLGILFNLGADYEKAADCFQAALNVNPDDSLLWNRLGATLANGGKSAEAIGAYRRSLEISPGFIRTRYNLGISCVNLGAYKEAAEHFLSSLNVQSSGKIDDRISAKSSDGSRSVMSDSIWSSLRMILHLLDRSDLTPAIDARDLVTLNKEFQIQPPS